MSDEITLCPECGSENAAGAVVCRACGAVMPIGGRVAVDSPEEHLKLIASRVGVVGTLLLLPPCLAMVYLVTEGRWRFSELGLRAASMLVLSLVLAAPLIAARSWLLRKREWARRMTVGFVAFLLVVAPACFALMLSWSISGSRGRDAEPEYVWWIILAACFVPGYLVAPVWFHVWRIWRGLQYPSVVSIFRESAPIPTRAPVRLPTVQDGRLGAARFLAVAGTVALGVAFFSCWYSGRFPTPQVALAGLALTAVALAMTSEATVPRATRQWGCAALVLCPLTVMLFPMAMREREASTKTQCLANVKHIAHALSMYAADHGAFPPADEWQSRSLDEYLQSRGKDVYLCPTAPKLRSGYAYNAALGGLSPDTFTDPGWVVSVFESDRGWNAAGGEDIIPVKPRHMTGDNLGFADGHVKWCMRLRRDPEDRNSWQKRYAGDEDNYLVWEPSPLPVPAAR